MKNVDCPGIYGYRAKLPIIVLVSVLYAIFAFYLLTGNGIVRIFTDTNAYFSVGASNIYSNQLWAGIRAPLAPLFFKVLGFDQFRIANFQIFISLAAWCYLGISIALYTRSLVVGLFGLLMFFWYSLTDNLAIWHNVILSESLSLSVMIALIASWVIYIHKQNVCRTILVLLAGVALAMVRDTYAYIIALLGVWLLLASFFHLLVLRQTVSRSRLLVAAAYCVIFVLSAWSHNAGNRWVFPFYNLVSQRVLVSNERKEFFQSNGMPINAALISREGKWANSDNWFYYNSPNLDDFRAWATASGKQVYVRYLISNPSYFFSKPLKLLPQMFGMDLEGYAPDGFKSILPGTQSVCIFNSSLIPSLIIISGLVISIVIFSPKPLPRPLYTIALAIGALAIPHYLITFHGDAMEVNRHCFLPIVQIYLSLLIATITVLDQVSVKIANELSGYRSKELSDEPLEDST